MLCVDAIQFAPQQDAAYRELRRVLAPGGRVVLTCWEPVSPATHGSAACARSAWVPD